MAISGAASAGEWVRQIVAASSSEPMATEAIWKALDKYAGAGPNALARLQAVLEYIDDQLIERNDGPVMRGLWAAVADYLEKVQEGLAAA